MHIMILAMGLLMGSLMPVCAQTQASKDTITPEQQQELWKQPDFVKAYYVVCDQGGALYTIFGHACLHLICPVYNLDYYFSYESEDAAKKFWQFLKGDLKMGMAALTPEEFLSDYEKDSRGVREYELNLPIDVKRELWRVLDQHALEGMNLPYDFESRGCAYACLLALEEALNGKQMNFADWTIDFERSRREICYDFAKDSYPWNLLTLMVIVGVEGDKEVDYKDKLVLPNILKDALQDATLDGEYVLSKEEHIVLPSLVQHKKPWFTPIMAAILLLLLAIGSLFMKNHWVDYVFLVLVTFIGALETYLVIFSTLPCTSWSWYLIPFNLLPAIAWKWRNKWSIYYAGILVLWMVAMAVPVHRLVDPSMLILTAAWVVVLVKNAPPIGSKKR